MPNAVVNYALMSLPFYNHAVYMYIGCESDTLAQNACVGTGECERLLPVVYYYYIYIISCLCNASGSSLYKNTTFTAFLVRPAAAPYSGHMNGYSGLALK